MKFSFKSSKVPFRTSFFYGWIVLAISFVGIFFSGPGQTYSISIFINSYIEEFNWSRTFVSSIYSAATIASGTLLFFIGRLVDKFGGRKVSVFIGIMMAIACLWNSMIISPAMLFAGFFMARYFGQGSMTLIPSTIVPQWFVKRRAFAFSIMSMGGVLGAAFIPPFNTYIIQNYSWNVAWRIWAILLLLAFVPLAFLFLRNTPESVGLLPDGKKIKTSEANINSEKNISEDSWTLQEAMKNKSFWLMIFCVSIPSMVNTGIVFHIISILSEKNISVSNSALVISVMAIVAFPGTFLAGFVLDRVKVNYAIAATFAGHLISMVILIYVQSFALAIAYGVLRGVLQGFEGVNSNIVWPNYFGRRYLGSIRGFITTIFVIASALGPLPFGLAFDFFNGYTQILVIMLIFPLLGLVAALLAPKPKKIKYIND